MNLTILALKPTARKCVYHAINIQQCLAHSLSFARRATVKSVMSWDKR